MFINVQKGDDRLYLCRNEIPCYPKGQKYKISQYHEPGKILLAIVLREGSPSIHMQRRAKKKQEENDIRDLRNFKNKIEGQVLGDVLIPKNLDKDKEFV